MTESKIVPIRDVMPIGKPVAPPRPCAANTPVTWGELYLLFSETHPDLAEVVLDKIVELDAAAVA
ncbi:hypothetical protein [Devosia salina]|uniref:Uncharacterized protein n=1 Tax=Devosia salina TaxID=2860336 RepID=A0ABX8W9G1_9HYPH|nr:hypothetical protein [Devosia salina]QYO75341.1 hypothetical protein K1X15_11845 [Devosia salina]